MKVIDPGHTYIPNSLDGELEQVLVFVKREGEKYPGNMGRHSGTTTQEVLRCLIDRIKYVDKQIPCCENESILSCLRLSIYLLEKRAAERHNRSVNFDIDEAVNGPTCIKCGHIRCEGKCHE